MLNKGKELTGARVNTHGVAALYCVLDLLVSQKPLRLLHVLYPVVFGVSYTAFSAVYYLAGGRGRNGSTVIYPVLDWESSPWKTLAVSSISNFLVIPMVHSGLWGLGLIFEAFDKKCGTGGGRGCSKTRGINRGEDGVPKTGGYDLHVDTETSSYMGNSSRNSRVIENSEGRSALDSAHYFIDERSLA
ncbi:protein rolling stone-like Protein [Elysia marginata]|uniref:Protein rolling stone-like Protein n=1 Tax=Elysia marginata TaxID=1093978 RepID=A0AAV4EBL7_9GAST|nr:protein rolling stone-like Protein [Elysia marginata]